MNLLCNITNEKFEFVQMNLKHLAEKIKSENNMSVIDILKHCKELSFYYQRLYIEPAEVELDLNELEQRNLIQKNNEYGAFSDYVSKYYVSPYKESLKETLQRIETDYCEGKEFLKFVGCSPEDEYTHLYEKMTDLSEIKCRYEEIYITQLENWIQNRRTFDMKHRCDTYHIIINICENNKIELIDGFQRLFTYNPSDLDFNGVVKVYHNLSNENFIKVLDAAKNWKLNSTNQNQLCDAGYLFALKQRFNFDKDSFKNLYKLDIVSILNAYNKKIPQYVDNKMFFKDLDTIQKIINTEFPIDETAFLSRQIVLYTLGIMGNVRSSNRFDDYNFVEMFENTCWSLKNQIQKRWNMGTQGHIENFLEKEIFPKYKEFLSKKR